ncbi:hypothetical protein P170DRAFT_363504 [Aspergillus steynii IBT 23096]|uniref:HTH CENPB-type domain-containing protein n=1 Tax=Aspergillus steynii IBT 23096 TaxID=1392250 RepID=A0A2I2G1N2_9EURO|nr:uncharacterized protein P170DRAFT_363504 [Aspergillus steynii IBT 23096]PLB46780.1 hypothetical protein P170DRAFT_363504 [Aspergillus steynii IBT 23096]
MDTESSHGQDSDFAQSPWMDMGGFTPSQHSPPLDYHGFGYGVMPLDSAYDVSIPPPYASLPLTLPSSTWPSMLTPGQYPEAGLPPVPIQPSVAPVAPIPPPRKSSTSSSTPRRTLTDDDRRRMCLYHEENKTAKQTDIGALFGVERSTVSKVLRQKEKYLSTEDGSRSPIKRAKGRVPDIEKALSNWVRNYQRHGYSLSDEMIREKALFFASTCGSNDGKEKVLTTSWLEKFKHKNNLLGAKSRKSSFSTTKSDSDSPTGLSINSALASAIQSPTLLSPTSPGFATPSPLSPTQSQDNIKAETLAELISDYQQHIQKSTTPLDTTVTSPTSTLVSESPFTPTSQSRNPSADSFPSRPRSQTCPLSTVDPGSMIPDQSSDQVSPRTCLQPPFPGTLQESPMEDRDPKKLPGLDTSANMIKRNRSNPEIRAKTIYPPLFSKSTTVSPVSSPGSPTQDEARKALELVMNYFEAQPTGLGAQEYVTIGKLMERLELAKGQQTTLPGGLTRIDEHEDAPHVARKRSIRSLG